jgi:photosystem II stability/assembly factor-like uncharacterized protein
VYAQWKYLGGPDSTQAGGQRPVITSLYVTNCEVFAGTDRGLFKSTDGCKTWTRPGSIDSNLKVTGFVRNNNLFFAGTDAGGVYESDDDGITWRKMNAFDSIFCLAVTDSFIFAGNTRGMQKCRIDDSVWSWVAAEKIPYGIISICAEDSVVVAGGYQSGVYRSNNFGCDWMSVTSTGLPSAKITSVAISRETVFASIPSNGIYCVVNCGLNWARITDGASTIYGDVAVIDNSVLVATKEGIYNTDFFGTTWHSVNTGLESKIISTFFLSGNSLYAGSEHDGIWYRSVSDFNVPVIRPFDHQKVRKTDSKLQFSNNLDHHSVINFIIPESMHVKVALYDISGHNLCTPVNGYFNEGVYSIPLSNDNIAYGSYIVKMNAGGSVLSARYIIR